MPAPPTTHSILSAHGEEYLVPGQQDNLKVSPSFHLTPTFELYPDLVSVACVSFGDAMAFNIYTSEINSLISLSHRLGTGL